MTPADALDLAIVSLEKLTRPRVVTQARPFNDRPIPGRTPPEGICHAGDSIFDTYIDAPIIIDKWDGRAGTSYYNPKDDIICCVPISHFPRAKMFYSILFHEIAHSTGHPDRLNRRDVLTKPLANRGREELVAELTAASLMEYTGLADMQTIRTSADYLSNWMQTQRETSLRSAIDAVRVQAVRAINWILGKRD